MKGEKSDIKRIWMYGKIANLKKHLGNESTKLVIRRTDVYTDSFEQFKSIQFLSLQKPIQIAYINEEAQDAGGLFRDWLTLLIKEILRPENGLFITSDTEHLSYIINRFSEKSKKNHLQHFYFFGQILGKALFERVPVCAFLNQIIFKYILDMKIDFDDLEFYDLQIFISLQFLRDNPICKSEMYTEFVAREKIPHSDEMTENELIENGKNILVDDENKFEFISKL